MVLMSDLRPDAGIIFRPPDAGIVYGLHIDSLQVRKHIR